MGHNYDILIPGDYFCDIIFTGIPGFPALGTELYTQGLTVVPGGILNTVIALTRLGVNVGWLGTFGNDFFSRLIADTLRTEGVDLSLIEFINQPLKRVTVSLSYPDDRAFVSYVDPVPESIESVFAALEKSSFRHLHYTGLTIDPRMPELLDLCHSKQMTVSMDCQHKEDTLDTPLVREILGKLDIFMPNAIEAQRLTETPSLDEAASTLTKLVPYLVIKDGANGSYSWRNDGHYHVAAIPVPNIVDTTGAGDVFNAGFLAAYFADKSPQECLQWGNIAGGLSLRGHGGYSTAPTLEELSHYLNRSSI